MKEWMIWLGTGVSLIDEEHMHFLKLIQLVKKSSADQCKRLVSRKFLEHTQTIMKNHFENEEQLMLKLDYDGLSTQIQEHIIMLDMIRSMIEEHDSGGCNYEIIKRITSSLEDHITSLDVRLAVFIKSKKSYISKIEY